MPVYCLISGCATVSADVLAYYAEDFDCPLDEAGDQSHGDLGPLVLQAMRELVDAEEGVDEVTVIGDFEKADELAERTVWGELARDEALELPDSRITVRQNCTSKLGWYEGFSIGSKADGERWHLVSYGVLIMVQTFSLPILHLATRGRLTLHRLWRLAMHQGWSEHNDDYGLNEVDYGEINYEREESLAPIPWMNRGEVKSLEKLGDVEAIKDVITHRGGYWMWMKADRFPLYGAPKQKALSSFTTRESSTNNHTLSAVEILPLEILHMIALECSLTSLVSFASVSSAIRSVLLGSESTRNSLAAAWIMKNAPWFAPSTPDLEPQYDMQKVHDAWAYLQRCCASGSMRNRARIWKVATQIEEVAMRSGICA